MINHNSQGYGKFVIDEQSLDVFEERLSDIECRLTRKQIYNILFDMIKSGQIAASRVMKIMKKHIVKETAEDVINDNSKFIPAILKKYVPEESYEQHNADLFEIMLQILESKKFDSSESTKQLITNNLIQFAESDIHSNHICKMFTENKIMSLKGEVIEGVTLTIPQKHEMVKVIYSSPSLNMDQK